MQKLRVGVLFGGRSCEHEVSLVSGRAILQAIDTERFEVVPLVISPQGQWLRLNREDLLCQPSDVTQLKIPEQTETVSLLPTPMQPSETSTVQSAVDVIFPVLHGTYGEDGTVQGLLELANLPYVGSGVLGSAVSMDKIAMKAMLKEAGLPVAPYLAVNRSEWQRDAVGIQVQCEQVLGYPIFIKPANMGSSVGVSKVSCAEEFVTAMDLAVRFDRRVLIESSVEDAMEIELAVLGNENPEVSVPGEIVPGAEFYDYQAKYVDDCSSTNIPAKLPEEVAAQLQWMAAAAFRALDCAGLARIDFLVRRRDYQAYVLEANTLPGFTDISMYPKLWQASGVSYSDLITHLIELAIERHEDKQRNETHL